MNFSENGVWIFSLSEDRTNRQNEFTSVRLKFNQNESEYDLFADSKLRSREKRHKPSNPTIFRATRGRMNNFIARKCSKEVVCIHLRHWAIAIAMRIRKERRTRYLDNHEHYRHFFASRENFNQRICSSVPLACWRKSFRSSRHFKTSIKLRVCLS